MFKGKTHISFLHYFKTVTIFFLFCILLTSPSPVFAEETEDSKKTPPTITLPDFSEIVKNLTPVTVNISTTKTVKSRFHGFGGAPFGGEPEQGDPYDDFFRRFFGDVPREYKQRSGGSGFIIDSEGYIITNNHVVADADEIKVKTSINNEYDAEIIGRDPKTDIALIKIKDVNKELPFAVLGDSDSLKVGEWVLAIGNPFGLQETVTAGIVSAKWRKIGAGPYEDFIQTDASINPGNSGGPLFNIHGEVVGVNTMIISQSGGNVGIGLAIPINLAKNIVNQLKEKGRVVRGWLGVIVQTVTPELAQSFGLEEGNGALVSDVSKDGPAENAGIKAGDIILSFDGKEVKEMSDLPLMVAETPIGKKAKVIINRDGKKKTIQVKIGELKEKKPENTAQREKDNIGITVREITPELADRLGLPDNDGVIISYVERGTPADEAGLKNGDIIKEVNRKAIQNVDDYEKAILEGRNGNILLLVKRGGSSLWVIVKPKE